MKKISLFDTSELATDDRGVSPVIGVILMVAITVILAAVIASFVLGFGGSVSSNASAGVDVEPAASGGGYNVTVISLGENTDGVKCTSGGGTFMNNGSQLAGVGDTLTNCEGSVVAVGADGSNANNATVRTLD